jgi:tape measure domain-containing protein
MAANNSRDVRMTLSVETLGADDIKKLQSEVAHLAKEGGDAAPEFQKLADEIGRLGEQAAALRSFQALSDQTTELANEQGRTALSTLELRAKLDGLEATTKQVSASHARVAASLADVSAASRDTKTAIELLALNTSKAEKADAGYKAEKDGLSATLIFQKAQVASLTSELQQAASAVKKASDTEAKLADEYRRSAAAAAAAVDALKASKSALDVSVESANRLGVATDNVALAQAKLIQSLNQTGSSAKQASDKLSAAAIGAKEFELAVAGVANKSRNAAVIAEEAAQKIKDAFQTVGVRSAQDLQAEITRVRAAMDTVRASAATTGSALTGAFSAGEARINALEREIRSVSGTLTTADKAASLFKNSLGQIAAGNIIADGVGYLVNKVKELGAAFISTIVQTEQLRKGLQAVYKDTALATTQFNFLKTAANTAGVDVAGLGQSFLKFSAANKSANVPLADTNALFLSVAQAGSALGLSGEQVNGTLDALGQIASKGTVSMEELRQQLGDRLPGALGIVAKSLGITDAQLIKLVESGGLAYRDFVVPFTKGLAELHGATDGLLPSWQRFKNALTETAQTVGDAGFTDVLTAGLKALAAVSGAVVLPLAALVEGFFLVGKGAAALASGLSGNKDALREFTLEVEKSEKRLTGLQNTFLSAMGVQDRATAAQNASTAAMQAAGLAAVKAALSVDGVSVSQKAQAFAAALAANATLDHGAKLVQLNTFISEALVQQSKLIDASEKTAKASKAEGDALVELAHLKGDDGALTIAQAAAANQNTEALAKVNVAHLEETRLLQLQHDALVSTALDQDKDLEKRKVQIELIEGKLKVSKAETEQSTQAEAAARTHALALGLSAEAYRDNALKVGEYSIKLAEAYQELTRVQRAEAAGVATKKDVSEAQAAVAAAQNRVNDALKDSIALIAREASAKSAALDITKAKLAVEQAALLNSAAAARASGDYALALQYEIQAKEVQIKGIRASVEVKKLEFNADLSAIEVQRAQIPVGDALRKVKEAELDTRIAVIKAKQIELGLSGEAIRALEAEVTALRNSNGARGVSNVTIGTEAGLRASATAGIDLQADAYDRMAIRYKNSSDYTQRQIDMLEREAAAIEKVAEATRKRLQVDKDGFSVDKSGSRIVATESQAQLEKRVGAAYGADFAKDPRAIEAANIKQQLDFLRGAGNSGTNSREVTDLLSKFSALESEIRQAKVELATPKDAGRITTATPAAATFATVEANALAAEGARPGETLTQAKQRNAGSTATTPSGKNVTVNINLGGNSTSVNVASDADAKALTAFLRGLESAKGVTA